MTNDEKADDADARPGTAGREGADRRVRPRHASETRRRARTVRTAHGGHAATAALSGLRSRGWTSHGLRDAQFTAARRGAVNPGPE